MFNRNLFPQCGRVVILDDNADEVKGLTSLLSEFYIPYVLLDHVPEEYDRIKTLGIRIVFLDLVMNSAFDEKAVKSTLIGFLNKLIKSDNGPYIVAIWSTQKEHYEEQVKEIMIEIDNPPLKYFYLDKTPYKEYNDTLKDNLKTDFETAFNGCEYLGFISLWENAINESMTSIATKLYSYLPKNNNVNDYVVNLAKMMLAKFAFEGDIENTHRISAAYESLNLLLNKEANSRMFDISQKASEFVTTTNAQQKIEGVKANTLLWIGENYSYKAPKNVYLSNEKEVPYLFDIDQDDLKYVLEIDITHKCTFFQKKTRKSGHQFVKAVLFSKGKFDANEKKNTYLLKIGDVLYQEQELTLVVLLNEIICKKAEDIVLENAIFAVSDEVYNEIRSYVVKAYGQSGKVEFE